MSLARFEVWVHDHVLKNDGLRHVAYGLYQRILWLFSKKIKSEGAITRITPDDGFEYLFGYYDKCPWSPNEKKMLALQVKDSTSKADSDSEANLVIIDLAARKTEIVGKTHCWNTQQGCMAQWIDDNHIIFNDFRSNCYVSVVLDIDSKFERVLPMPIYSLSPDKKTALTLDFSRLHTFRPGYGYCNLEDKTKNEKCPDSPCIWKIDIESGAISSVLTYFDFATFEPRPEMKNAFHKVNHLMISPDGNRFMVLHRWLVNNSKFTRLVTCNIDGTGLFNLSDDNFVSHCCWKDNETILSYLNKRCGGKGYYILHDKTQNYERIWPELVFDGHPSYSCDGKRVVTDTYPDRKRIQSIYVMDGGKVARVARVFMPFKFKGDCRCDLHPRWSPDGSMICFDGSFDGKRSMYCVGVSK